MSGLCYTCCPRQMRGPALKGLKMKGFGVKYFFTLSSRKRSGSNTRAGEKKVYEYHAFCSEHTNRQGPRGLSYDA